jgi:ribose transport system substrate-binding protein
MKNALIVVVLVIVAGIFIAVGISRKGKIQKDLEIAVIPKGTTHIFWQSVKQGAQKAAAENNVKMFWNGPEREGDREKQIQIIEDFIVRDVSGVVLAPLDDKALVPSVEKLHKKNIPAVIIDSSVNTDKYLTFAATDNYKGGVLAARQMAKLLEQKGKVIVVKYAPGSASTVKRENGFIQTIKNDYPQIEIIDSKYGLDTVETALQAVEDLLTRNPVFDGIYACNESTTTGTLRALHGRNLAGKVKFVGFDSSPLLIEAIKQKQINALIVQNPFKMGYEGVTALIAHIKGNQVPKKIDTGVSVVTLQNISDPEIMKLLNIK